MCFQGDKGHGATSDVPGLHEIDRPALVHRKFNSRLLLSRVVGVDNYIWFLGTTHESRCSQSTQNAEDKQRQSGAVLSPPGGGFEPRTSATKNVV